MLFISLTCLINLAEGQTAGDFRTIGNVTFSAATNWQRFNGAVWGAAAAAPAASDGVITIQNGHTATLTVSKTLDQIVVASGGVLTINSGQTLAMNDLAGTDLDVSGTINNSGSITPTGTIVFNASSVYNHAQDGGTIPNAAWSASSNCNITGIVSSSGFAGGLEGKTFGNFIWNSPSQTSNFYLESNFTIAGDFTVTGTGTFNHTIHSLRMSNTATGYLITVAGDVLIDNSASFKLSNNSGSCTLNIGGNLSINSGNFTVLTGIVNPSIVNVSGNVNITGGTLCLKEDVTALTGTMTIKGDFTFTGGTVSQIDGGGGIGAITFNGNTPQIYSNTGGTFLNNINFSVNNGAILDLGTSIIDGSTGTFTVNAGGGIITGHSQGLSTSPLTGSIQVTGARTFNTAADYTFDGTLAQVTGNALTTVHNLTIDNPAGVSLTNGITVNGFLSLVQGKFTTGANILTLANGSAGSLSYGATSFISGNFERFVNSTSSNYYFPVGVTQRQMAKFNFTNLTNGSLRVNFQSSDPTGSGLPLIDTDNQIIKNEFNNGYWTALARNSLASNNYDLTIDAAGFNNPDNINSSTRVIKRTGVGAWTINGTPGTVSGTILERLDLSGIDNSSGSQFGAGTGNCFIFTGQPNSITRCVGGNASFSVSALGGLGVKTYQWYKNGAQIFNGGNISGAITNNLSISNLTSADESSYYCLVTDNCSSQPSQNALLSIPGPAAVLGYGYEKTITIDHNKVSGSSDLINFPVLINISNSPEKDQLRTVANGGHVENANGYDIIFTDANYKKLDHQVETYTSSDGTLIAWVRIPVLSTSSNTTIKLLYGNPQITIDPSSMNTWETGYSAVYHMNNLLDATAFNNDGSNVGSASAAGFIGTGRQFNGTSRINVPQNNIFEPTNNVTVSLWMKRNGAQNLWATPVWYGLNDVDPFGPYGFEFFNSSDNEVGYHIGNGSSYAYASTGSTVNNATWYLLTGTYDGTNNKIYLDDVLMNTVPITGPVSQYNSVGLTIGDKAETGQGFTGFLDEIRISRVNRSADWIKSEFANQSSPGSFYSIGSETTCSVFSFKNLCSGAPITYSIPGIGGHTYSWSVNGGNPSATIGNSITVNWNASGPYNIQLSESNGTCNGSSLVYNVVVTSQPVAQTITKLPNVSDVCVTGTVSATFSGGSGGVSPADVYESSVDGGSTWLSYTSGSPISSATAGINRLQIRTRRTTSGTGCTNSGYNLVTWNTIDQPVAQTIIKSPNVTDVCVTGTVSATFSGGSGGVTPSDVYESSINGGTTWQAYTSGSPISSGIAGVNRLQIRTRRTSAGTGCSNSADNVVTWNTNAQPAGPTVNVKTPNLASVCEGQIVSVTFNAGSGGTGCSDVFQYRFDGGGWLSYSGGTNLNTTGHTLVEIQGQRSGCTAGAGCSGTAWVLLATWNVNTQPVGPTLNVKTPNLAAVCDGQLVSATFTAGSGGAGCTDIFQYRIDGGGWLSYTGGTNLNTTGHTLVEIQGQRSGCTVGAGCSGTAWVSLASWIVNPNPVPSISGSVAVCPGSSVIYSTPLVAGHNYAWTITGATGFTGDGTNQITVNWGAGPLGVVSLTETIGATGCSTVATTNVSVTDNTLPTITCPAAIAQNVDAAACSASVIVPNATIADNCSLSFLTWAMTGATIATSPATGINQVGTYTFNTGITTVTFIVKDGSGNQATCNFAVNVTDNINPTITCPSNVVTTTSTDGTGNCTTTAVLGVPITADNCSVASVIAQVGGTTINPATYLFPIGITTVNWIVTDGSGRTANCNQTVTVTDNEDPTITCPSNIVTTTSADGAGNCTTTAVLGVPVTADNCSVASVVAQVGGTTINPATYLFPIGVTTVNWIVTDGSGRTANCNQTVTVTDNENPTITCPSNIVTTTSSDGTGNCTTTAVLGVPVTADNCSVASVVAQVGGTTINPATYLFPIGVTTVNWIVTDGSGRTANCNQTVTVTDNEDPTITCPSNIVTTTSSDGTGNCTTTAVLGAPVTADNCSVASVVAQVGGTTINPATYLFPIGVTTVNWIVTDGSGRTANCNQTVTVTDNEDPTITCPSNIVTTTSADGTGNCTTTAVLGAPITADNCSVASVVAQVGGTTINPATYLFPIGVTTVNWIVTDGSGRTANCNQTVTVTDNENPTITCPANVITTTSSDGTGNCTTTAVLGLPVTSDNCSVASVIAQVGGTTINPATYLFPIGVTTVNWVVTDGSGRTANCNQTVTVTDNEDPTITCPSNIVTTSSSDGTGNCTTTAVLGVPITADNCSVASVIAQVGGTTINPATYLFPIGVTTVNWIVTDGSGRTANCNQTVTVTDNENPTITCPSNIVTTTSTDGAGNCTTTAVLGVPVTADNCSVASVIAQVGGTTINPATYLFPIGVTTVNWIVADGSGRTANCNQTVTVTDNENPTITCPSNIVTTTSSDGTGNCTTTAVLGAPVTADNCSVASVIAQVGGTTINPATYLFPIGVTTVNWIVTDGSGRTANCNQTVTVTDNEDPTITCPSNIVTTSSSDGTGNCTTTAVLGVPITADNCSVASVIAQVGGTTINPATYLFPIGVTTVNWIVTDGSGRTANCNQTVTVTDNEDPTITCPSNIVTTTSTDGAGNCTTTAVLGVPVTADNCSVASVIAQVGGTTINPATYLFPIGVTTVNWVVTDGSGRTANCNQTVTVTDNENPTITCPSNIVTTTSSDGTGNCTTTAVLGVPITADNCSVASVIAQVGGTTINPATYLFPIGVTAVNWIVTDGSGRTANCNQTVTVTDNENPTITCPSNIVTTTSSDGTGNCTTTAVLGAPVTADNCSVASVVAQVGGTTINPATYLFPIGVTTVNWIVTDGSGRTANCNQTVTVTDNENPTITCPANVITTTSSDGTGNCTTTAVLGLPVTSDNCSVASVIAQVGGTTINPATYLFPIGVTTVNWVVTDGSGRTANCNQTVTVTDNEDPTITCPSNVVTTTSTDGTGNCTTTAALGAPVTADNCSVASVVAQVGGSTINPATYLFPIGVTTVNWIVTDGSGRTANCNQTVTVTDNENPTITCPSNIVTTTSSDGTGNCTTTAALGAPVTADNCSVASVIAQVGGSTINPATYLFPIGVTTVNWIVADGSGRTANCNQTVTVTDNEDPTITCPSNIVTTTSSDGTGNCTTTAVLGVPVTADNCSVASVVAQVGGTTINPATYLFPIGVTTVNWIVTDGSGRTANCNQTVTVTDNEDPTITCPSNIVTTTSSDGTGNCTTTAVLGVPITADNCSVASVVAQVGGTTINPATYLFPIGVTTVNWIVTDGSGRTANCNQTVTVTDNENPTITCPSNVVTTTSSDGTGNCTTTAVLGAPVTADNCSVASVIAQVGGTTINPATYLFPIGVTTVNWIVTDGSGRTANCNQTVTVTDNEDPTITCPSNIVTTTSADGTGNCTTTAVLGVPVTADNCSVASVIAQVGGTTINPATYLFPIGVTTVNWIVTDGSGRTANCNQTVTVTDNEDPTITCPSNIVTTTSTDGTGNCTTTAVLGVPVTADNCSVASVIAQVGGSTINPATYLFPIGVTTVNWIVTDGSGRTANCNQTVTVTDNENPTITCPSNIVTTTSTDGTGNCTTTAALGAPVTADNCSVASVIAQVGGTTINPATYLFPIGVTTVNWIVTDGSGRTANCNQTVTVTDNEDPTITCPSNIVTTTSSDGTGNCTTTAVLGVPVTADNCSVASVIAQVGGTTINPATYLFPIGVTTVNWIVTDGSGRTANCNQTVTVTDNENPTITCPSNIVTTTSSDGTGNCTTTAVLGVPVTADNCSVASVIAQVGGTTINPATYLFPIGVTTVNWIVTDGSGRTANCNQTVTVTDNEDPTITCPSNIVTTTSSDGTGNCTTTAVLGVPVTADNCSVASVIAQVGGTTINPATYLFPIGVTTVNWIVTDGSGRTANCNQTVTVTDNENPSITCPANIIHAADPGVCSYTVSPGVPITSDNCGVLSTVGTRSDLLALTDPYPVGSTTIHWIVTDIHGNTNSCNQTVSIADNEIPSIACPPDFTHDSDAGMCSYTFSPVLPVTSDNCAVSGVVGTRSDALSLANAYPVGLTTIHWVVTDIHGNTNSCDQKVTITDNEDPSITCPADIVHSADAGLCSYSVSIGTPVTGDNCGVATVSGTRSDFLLLSSPYPVGMTTIHWLVTDIHGNSGSCDQTVTITDNEAPTITCPADIVHTSDAGSCYHSLVISVPVTADNCAVSGVIGTRSDSQLLSDPYPVGITIIHWEVTDIHGNTSSCDQTITITDDEAPTISCPFDIVHSADPGLCSYSVLTGIVVTSDNCGVSTVVGTRSDSQLLTDPYPVGITTIHWVVTDIHGNTNSCNQTITVSDDEVPTITCPPNSTINCEDDNTPAGTGTATATDNCTPVINIIIAHSDLSTYSTDPLNILHYNYVISRKWRATDVAGNFSECTQSITVHDVTNPVITCPANLTINCEDDNTPASTGTATATDICTPIANIAITHSDLSTYDANPSNALHYNYVIARTWRATDVSGNFSECVQTITVHDISKPVINCPANVTLNCEDDNTPAGTGTATATDICTPLANITITRIDLSTYDASPSNVLHYNYVILRTWRATDVAGNFSECTQTITVHDISKPVITCPANVTLNCEDDNTPAGAGTATATDICTPLANITITHSDLTTYSADPSNVLHYNYVISRTWRATDVSGNYSECTQTITVHDITNPVISCPPNVTLNCEDDNTPAGTGTATATDICTPVANIAITHSDLTTYSADPSNVLHYNYVISRTWRATDISGNFSQCTQTITVHDITNPVISCPANVTISCEDDNAPAGTGRATATDICTPVANIAITHSDLSTYDADPSTVLHYNYVITRTWRATDVTGNFSECIQTITINDISNPVISCPSNVTISCEDDNTIAGTGTATATDNCTPSANISIIHSDVSTYDADPSAVLHYNYIITRTWRATDVSGNFSECVQTITVHDISKPVITCPANVTLNCEDDNTPAGTGTATATDICTPLANITITRIDLSTFDANPSNVLHYNYVISRTWRATDVAGNFSECTQTITVHDISKPVITCPANVTLNCEDDNTPAGAGIATATDICTPLANITITHSDLTTYSADPSNVLHYNYVISRTWRATDVSGNFSECTQTIIVHDITNPVISCPANVIINCEDDNTPAGTGTATATDFCAPVANIAITHSDLSTYDADPSTVLHYNYVITRTWRATDISGNFSECIQTITVQDISKPVITCPANVTISCEDDNTTAGTGSATATDNCTPAANITIVHSDVSTYDADPSTALHYNYVIARTWRATDVTGNFNECTQTITIHDVTKPVFTVPNNITVCRAPDCSYDASTGITGDVSDESDNCTPSSLLNAIPTDDNSGVVDCDNFGFILRTWTLTDISGNSTVKVQTIWVEPVPSVSIVNNSPVICDGANVNILISSPTISTLPANLSYVVTVSSTDPPHLGGSASTGFTLLKSDLPYNLAGTLTNSSDAPISVSYTITPKLSGCSNGLISSVTVIVNPTPRVIPDMLTQTICNDGTTGVTLGSPSIFSSGVITFNYTVTATGGVTGFVSPVNGINKDSKITDVLHNPTDLPQTVTYTIVPVSPTGCPDGPSKTVIITVDPTPQVAPNILTHTICNDATMNITLASPSIFSNGVITFDYTVVATGGVTGFTTPVTGIPKNYILSDLLHNPTDSPQTVTYTVVPISPSGCAAGPAKTIIITVNPLPQVNPSTLLQAICNDGTTNIILGSPSTFTSGLITFKLTATATGGVTGFSPSLNGLPLGYALNETLHNPTDIPQTVTYTIIPLSPTGCPDGPQKVVVVTVDPTPQVILSATTQKICNDGSTSIELSSPSVFSSGVITFDYTVVATGGVTGFTSPTTGLGNNFVISDFLHNPTNDPQTVTYTIVPVSPSGCTAGPSKTVVITVEPTPTVNPGPLFQTLCNDQPSNILLTSPSTFTNGVITFNYTVVATGGITGFITPRIGLPNNYVISDVLHNPTDSPQTVTYTIVPISPECSATDPVKIVVITVNPTPQVIPSVLSQTICNGGTTNITLGSPSTFTTGVISFNYTVVATGGVTGFSTPLTGLPRDYIIADVLNNPTDAPQTVTYTIVPVNFGGCPDGPSKTVIVTVNPTPQVVPGILAQTICNDQALNILLGSPSSFNNGAITFNYTVTATGGVTGFTTPVNGLPKDFVLSDILHNPTDSPQTVTYTIVPVSPGGCASGPVKVIVITVNPLPQVIPSTLAQTICNDGTTNITLASPSIFTSGVITFSYSVVATGGVTGFTTPVTGLPKNYIISDVLHNPSDAVQTVTYTIIPLSPTGCPAGPFKTVVYTVNPTPQVFPGTMAQTICNDGTTNVILSSPSTFTSGFITFNYTVTATGGVTGFVTPVTGLPNNHIIADVLHNPTNSPQTVSYTIVPLSPTGCAAGPSKVVVITINPTPLVVPSTLAQTICNDGTTNVILGSPSIFTSGLITFNYTVTSTGGVTGYTTPVNGLPKNFVIADVLHNPTNSPQTVTYTIIPVSPNGCSAGSPKVVIITVNPTPLVNPSVLLQTICNDSPISVTLASPSTFSTGLITFNYTVVATGGVTGFTSPVTGLPNNFVLTDVLHNPTDSPQTVTYTVVPVSPGGCTPGIPKVIVITVNPTPQVVPSTLAKTICNDGTTNVILRSPSTFSTGLISFNYTVIATGGVTGFNTPVTGLSKNHIISDVLHNPTDVFQTVTYTVVPVSPSLCPTGPVKTIVVTVNPTPRIFPILSNSIQCDSLTTSITLMSPSVFSSGVVSFKYTVSSTGSVTGFSTPVSGILNNQIIADKLINTSDHFQEVTYNFIPVSPGGCIDGPGQKDTVTVNPTPRVIPDNIYPSLCYSGTNFPATSQIKLTSPTIMTSGVPVFDYTVSVTGSGSVFGNTTPGNNLPGNYTISLPYQNNSDTIQSVFFSIIPKVDNAICVPGKKMVSEIKVHAKPLQSIVITKHLTCSGGPGLASLKAVISKGADPYQIVWAGPVGYHRFDSLAIANLSDRGTYVVKVTDNLGCSRKDSVSLLPELAKPSISLDVIPPGNYNISCVGSTDGAITVSVNGGITAPYNYWVIKNNTDDLASGILTGNNNFPFDPSTYRRIDNLGAGSYKLIIRDVNGCMDSTTVVFRVPLPIVAVLDKTPYAGGYNVTCKGYNDGSAWVQSISGGRGGYTYRWYTFDGSIPGPVNTNRIDNLIAGTYFLEIKDVLGCVQTASIIIKEPDGMQLLSSQVSQSADGNFNISCNGGSNGSIIMDVFGGSGNYLYVWTGPSGFSATTKDISGLKAGVYSCSVRDLNGCVLTPSPTFTLSEPPVLAISSVTTSQSTDGAYNINCFGSNTGWINVSVAGGSIGNYSFNWTTNDGAGISNGSKDQPSLGAGTYHLVVTDMNGCIVTKDVVLTQPVPFVTKLDVSNITCKSVGFDNGSITLTVSGAIAPYTYLWSNGAITKDLTDLTPGNYSVTITDFNGCSKTEAARVDLPPALSYKKEVSDFNGFNISCNGLANGFIHVTSTSGLEPFVYTWTGPNGFVSSSNNISDVKAGQYSFLIVDKNECKATENFDLTEPGKLDMTVTLSESTAGGFNINCSGDSTGVINITPLNAVKTVDYLWSDGLFGKTRINLPAGKYNVIITDANNCHATSAIDLTQPDSLKIVFNILPPFCPDKPDGVLAADVTGGVKGADYMYKWSDNSSNRNLSNIPEGFYKVSVMDLNGCSIRDSIKVDPINETCLVIPKAISPNGDMINDVWNIGMKELYPAMEVKIFNRWGESIWRSARGYPVPWDGRSNGSSLPIDSYHYIIDLHNGSRPLIGNVTIVR